MVLGGLLLYPAPMARDVVRNYRDFMATAPDEIGGAMVFLTAPPADFVPEPARGQPMLGVVICYAGPIEEGEAALRSLRAFGPPVADLVQPMPYLAVQKLTEAGNPPGIRNYWTADFMTGLPDDAIDALVGIATKPVSPMTSIIVVPGGGAPSRVDEDATALVSARRRGISTTSPPGLIRRRTSAISAIRGRCPRR
jgi:hypothetical protein